MLGLYDERESPNLFPKSGTTVKGEFDVVRVMGVLDLLIKVGVAIVVGESLGFVGPGEVVGVVVALTVVELDINGGIEGSIVSSIRAEGDDSTENGVSFAESVL